LASNTVFSGFEVSWFFAPSPIKRSPSGVKATYDGVIRLPWSLAMISTRPFLKTPTLEEQRRILVSFLNQEKFKIFISKSSFSRYFVFT
jgi:hypothetical protein